MTKQKPVDVSRQRQPPRWPRVRAALLALHVLAILVLSFPGSSKLGDRKRWGDRVTQNQLALWATRLSSWGVDTNPQAFEETLWKLAQRYLAARAIVTAPVAPYAHVAPQGWGMFKAPPLEPTRLVIEVLEGAEGWRTVHRTGSAELDYLAPLLGNNRFRKQVGRVGRDATLFGEVARWLARRTFADFPDAKKVRVRVLRFKSLAPSERRSGVTAPEHTERQQLFRRESFSEGGSR